MTSEATTARVFPFLDLQGLNASVAEEIDAAIEKVIAHHRFINGPEVGEFECAWAGYCGTHSAAGMSSGTTALTALLVADGIGPGDEVIVPSHTFLATVESVLEAGPTPVFADIDEDTMTIDPQSVEEVASSRTAAVVGVHLYGCTGDWGRLSETAERLGLALFEDAAQAHGATWRGVKTGALGRGAAFSFFPGKNLGAFGDAGAITTNDEALGAHAKAWSNHGRTSKFEHGFLGVNARLDTLQAAVLLAKLNHLDEWNAARRRVAKVYQEAFAGTPVRVQHIPEGAESAWHLFVIRTPVKRETLRGALEERGVKTGVHYPTACHEQKACAETPIRCSLTRTEQAAASVVSLPMCPLMTAADAQSVADIVIQTVDRLEHG